MGGTRRQSGFEFSTVVLVVMCLISLK
uniref:Uncharacterized protein n=1 Tax=Anguilla anguilla TaxID=7936 RepID=A0A0E9VGP5_ANGAN